MAASGSHLEQHMYLLQTSQMFLGNRSLFSQGKTGLQVNNKWYILSDSPKWIKPLAELIFSWFFFTLSISGVTLKAVALPSWPL